MFSALSLMTREVKPYYDEPINFLLIAEIFGKVVNTDNIVFSKQYQYDKRLNSRRK